MATQAAYSWVASTARVIVLDGFGAVPRGTPQVVPQPLQWPAKDPSDTLDYVMDISEAIAGNEGDAIMTLDVVISPNDAGDLTLQSASASGFQAILWLTAGFAGTIYAVTVSVGTNSGRMLSRTLLLPVLSLAPLVPPPQAIMDQTGASITDQTNAPILASE